MRGDCSARNDVGQTYSSDGNYFSGYTVRMVNASLGCLIIFIISTCVFIFAIGFELHVGHKVAIFLSPLSIAIRAVSSAYFVVLFGSYF